MLIGYIIFSVSIAVMSWVASLLINAFFKRTEYYQKVSNLNFVRNKSTNKLLGVGAIKWLVINTPLKFFNPELKLGPSASIDDLRKLRSKMTDAEISHLIGFFLVFPLCLVKLFSGELLFSLVILLVNMMMNLSPSLLQQENKRRLDSLLRRYG